MAKKYTPPAQVKMKKTVERWSRLTSCYEVESVVDSVITAEQYINIVDPGTVKFFRSLGGSESIHTQTIKPYGSLVIKLTSLAPDKGTMVVREFEF